MPGGSGSLEAQSRGNLCDVPKKPTAKQIARAGRKLVEAGDFASAIVLSTGS